jgi:putative hydrolase of the HAD superfamily
MQELIAVFHEVNNVLWDRFNRGLIDMVELRNVRFQMILNKLGLRRHQIPPDIGLKYLEICPRQPHVIPETHEILGYLKEKYTLHIVTNGSAEVQHLKMKSAGIYDHFKEIVTPDRSGFRKPQRDIFEYALQVAGSAPEYAIVIGDNLATDIEGARNASLDHVYFNAAGVSSAFPVQYEISSLNQLRNIL